MKYEKSFNRIILGILVLSAISTIGLPNVFNQSKNTSDGALDLPELVLAQSINVGDVISDDSVTPSVTTESVNNMAITTKDSSLKLQSVSSITAGPPTAGFISTWNTSIVGATGSTQIALPLESTGTYNFLVDWGDNLNSTITSFSQNSHTYSAPGVYTINITGQLIGWTFNNGANTGGDKAKIIEISNWGDVRLGNTGGYFYGASNLVLTATDTLDLNGTTTLLNAFRSCANLGSSGDINSWDVSNVTSMNSMFSGASTFDMALDAWNTSNVYTMSAMFQSTSFQHSIGSWNTSKVSDMSFMFRGSPFNQSIDSWDTSNLQDVTAMFQYDSNFNQPLNSWNVSHLFLASQMFYYATSFNQPLNNWNVSRVINFLSIFDHATNFDQSVGDWNVSGVSNTAYLDSMFIATSLSPENYDDILIKWSAIPTLHSYMNFGNQDIYYTSNATTARAYLISQFSWVISDAGQVSGPSAPQVVNADSQLGLINLTWIAPASNNGYPVTNYSIYRSITSGVNYLLLATVPSNVFFYEDTNVTYGDILYYIIQANNSVGVGVSSSQVTGYSAPLEPLSAQATAGANTVSLSWIAPLSDGGQNIKYNVYRSTTSGSGYTKTDTQSPSLYFFDTSLTNGQTYYYIISAYNNIGEGRNSTEISATPMTTPNPPSTVLAVATSSSINISWTVPTDDGGSPITNYIVYKSKDGASYNQLVTVSATTFSVIDTDVTSAQPYYYYIIHAVNSVGESFDSLTASTSVLATVPSAPANLTAQLQAGPQVYLTWAALTPDGGSPLLNYYVYRSETSGSGYSLIQYVGPTTYFYVDNVVQDGHIYYYVVSAHNNVGESTKSNEVSVTIGASNSQNSTDNTGATTSDNTGQISVTSDSNINPSPSQTTISGSTPGFEIIPIMFSLFVLVIISRRKFKNKKE